MATQPFSLSDIFSLSDFQRNTKKHLQRLKKNGRPGVLTVNGKAEVVVIDAATYEQMQERMDYFDNVEKLRAGIKEADEGKGISAGKAFKQIRDTLSVSAKRT
mgnify:CR=1 FL=1